MLLELEIENFAIIKEQRIAFGRGLNVISGETGAGKSIVLEALKLLLGAKSNSDSIRSGEDTLTVRGLFECGSLPEEDLSAFPDLLLDSDGKLASGEILLQREVSSSGRSRVYINGKLGSVGVLQEITKRLISICGQNENLALLDPRFHLQAIDRFCGNEKLLAEYRATFQSWNEVHRRAAELQRIMQERASKNAEYSQILSELEPLKLFTGIRRKLEDDVRELSGGERLGSGLSSVLEALRSGGATKAISSIRSELRALSKISSKVEPILKQAEEILTLTDDLERTVSSLSNHITVDEERLATLRESLAEVARLERKYRTDDEGLIRLYNEAKEALDESGSELALQKTLAEEATLKASAEKLALRLSAEREKGANNLVKSVQLELSELAMSGAKLEVQIERSELSPNGIDKAEIYISPNKGEELKPLRQIASGGELSRIMLVLNKVLRDRAGLYVLVFDEVDSGISGGVARAVGEKLKALADDSQVICITHLPQVASLADRHILVQKQVGKRTETLIKILDDSDKVEEIARMLAGRTVTETARESARELLNLSLDRKS